MSQKEFDTRRVISGWSREGDKTCALLDYYAVSSNNSFPIFFWGGGQPIGPISRGSKFGPLKLGTIGFSVRPVRNYHYLLRNSPEDRSSCHSLFMLHRAVSLYI
jgi:hypothetical protein